MTLASHAVQAFSMRTAPGLAEAKPEYLFEAAASRSPSAEWNSAAAGDVGHEPRDGGRKAGPVDAGADIIEHRRRDPGPPR